MKIHVSSLLIGSLWYFRALTSGEAVWIGLKDIAGGSDATSTNWQWTSGQSFTYTLPWDSSMPDSDPITSTDCVTWTGDDDKFQDVTCATTAKYVCQRGGCLYSFYTVIQRYGSNSISWRICTLPSMRINTVNQSAVVDPPLGYKPLIDNIFLILSLIDFMCWKRQRKHYA